MYIYIYIYDVFFNPVNPVEETIASGQMNYLFFQYFYTYEKDINVNKFTDRIILFQEKKHNILSH